MLVVEEMKPGRHHRKIQGVNQYQEVGFPYYGREGSGQNLPLLTQWVRKHHQSVLISTSCGDSKSIRLAVQVQSGYCPSAQQEHSYSSLPVDFSKSGLTSKGAEGLWGSP